MKKQTKVCGTIYVYVDMANERDFERKMAVYYRVSEFHDVSGFLRYEINISLHQKAS